MIGAVLVLALLATQAFAIAFAWWGELAPDPTVLVAAGLALQGRPRTLLGGAVVVGWLRALVLLEPAGGQVLCAWAAVAVVASMRESLGRRALLSASIVAALVWAGVAAALSEVFAAPVSGGPPLLLGAALALPFTLFGAWRRRRRRTVFAT